MPNDKPPRWLRILVDLPALIARILGGALAMSFVMPDEALEHLRWLRRVDAELSVWYLFEFMARTAAAKPSKSYVLSAKGVFNILAFLPPTGLAPVEALRHAGRFLMTTTAIPFVEAIQDVTNAVRKIVVENRQSLDRVFTLVLVSAFLGGIIIAVLEQDIEGAWQWSLVTILPFFGFVHEFSPTTTSGQLLESLLVLIRYAVVTWLGALTLKTWRLAVGDRAENVAE